MRTRLLLRRLLAPAVAGAIMVAAAAPVQAATIVGVCTVIIGEPHASTHVNGTINSYGRLTCSLGMPEIYIRADLEKSTGQVWQGNTESWLNTLPGTTYTSTSAIGCTGNNGTYRTRVNVSFRSPSGVNPAYYFNTFLSIWRSVACGVTAVSPTAPAGSTSAEDSVSLTFLSDGTIREATSSEIATVPLDPAIVASTPARDAA